MNIYEIVILIGILSSSVLSFALSIRLYLKYRKYQSYAYLSLTLFFLAHFTSLVFSLLIFINSVIVVNLEMLTLDFMFYIVLLASDFTYVFGLLFTNLMKTPVKVYFDNRNNVYLLFLLILGFLMIDFFVIFFINVIFGYIETGLEILLAIVILYNLFKLYQNLNSEAGRSRLRLMIIGFFFTQFLSIFVFLFLSDYNMFINLDLPVMILLILNYILLSLGLIFIEISFRLKTQM